MVKYFDFWVNFIQCSITICLDNASGIGHGRRWRALRGGFMGDQFIAEAEWHRSWHWCHQKHSPGHDHWLMLAVNTMLPKVKYTEYAVPQYLFKSLTCFWIVFMAAFPWKVYQSWWFESYIYQQRCQSYCSALWFWNLSESDGRMQFPAFLGWSYLNSQLSQPWKSWETSLGKSSGQIMPGGREGLHSNSKGVFNSPYTIKSGDLTSFH